MFKIPNWGMDMAQSATPYTYPCQSKFTTIPAKRIYLPSLHLTALPRLKGINPVKFGEKYDFLFSAEKQCHHVPKKMRLAQLEFLKK